MQGLITPDCYRDVSYFEKERAGLFQHVWHFVGMRFELRGLSHRGVRVGKTNLLIQIDKAGNPRAFLNVCSHRHAQLCSQGLHQGPTRCPYHGWVYDRDGVPVGIPEPKAFPAVVAAPQEFRLSEFACEAVGEFIFVRISAEGRSLAEYLGREHSFLMQASKGMNGLIDEFREDVLANWKVLIENSLEGYHIPAVHSKTFMQAESMKLEANDKPTNQLEDPLHSCMTHPAAPDWLARFEQRMERRIGKWAWRFPNYQHHLIFPNLTVTSFMGYSFHVQLFEPTEAAVTTVHSRTIGVHFTEQDQIGSKLMQKIYADGRDFTARLFAEDSDICQKVQGGIEQAHRLAVLGEGIEDRVSHFHRAYSSMLKDL